MILLILNASPSKNDQVSVAFVFVVDPNPRVSETNTELMTQVVLRTTCKRVLPERQEVAVTEI